MSQTSAPKKTPISRQDPITDERSATDREVEKVQKSRNGLLLFIAIFVILASLITNIIFDAVEITPRTDTITEVSGEKKNYTVYKYAPEYKYTKPISEFFYTLGIALLVYLSVDRTLHRYDRKREETEAKEKQKEIDRLHALREKETHEQIQKKQEEVEQEREKIKQDIFDGVLKKIIPEELFEILASDILNKEIIRKNAVWEYEITENAAGTGYNLEQLIKYELCNISHKDNTPANLVLSVGQNAGNNSYWKSYEVRDNDDKIVHTNPPIVETSDGMKERTLELKLMAHQALKITHLIMNEYAGFNVTDCHYSNYSIVGLEIRVRKPTGCSFKPLPSFSGDLDISYKDAEHPDDAHTIHYKKVKGILKGQALVFLIDKIPGKVLSVRA